jgi:hypothetical protein
MKRDWIDSCDDNIPIKIIRIPLVCVKGMGYHNDNIL